MIRRNHSLKNMTVNLDKETITAMQLYPEVAWAIVARNGIKDYVTKRQLADKLLIKRETIKEEKPIDEVATQ